MVVEVDQAGIDEIARGERALRLVPGDSVVHRLWPGTKLIVAAELALIGSVEPSWLTLGVLVFPDYRDQFTVVDDLATIAPLPAMTELTAAATGSSPDVRADTLPDLAKAILAHRWYPR